MSKRNRDSRREELVKSLSGHVLREGLQAASLRPLAAAAGTSDRMLLYYFDDKEDLLGAILERIALNLRESLDQALSGRRPFEELLAALAELTAAPEIRPYMQLWLELAARSARGEEPFRKVAGGILDGFLDWTASRLDVAEPHRSAQATLLLCLIDGLEIFDAAGRRDLAPMAARGLSELGKKKKKVPSDLWFDSFPTG